MINQKGQILVIVFVALGVVLFTVLSVITGAQIYFSNASYSADAEKAIALAEAGVDKAINSLNKDPSGYNGEGTGPNGVAIGNAGEGEYSVTITAKDAGTKVIEASGYVPSKANIRSKRIIKTTVSRGVGASFVYGIQIGDGGLTMKGGNTIKGSIYSNGNIIVTGGGSENEVTGDVWVAGASAAVADQQTDCDGSNCTDYIFGKSVSGESRLDIAQSFKPSITKEMSKVSIKIKKFVNPPDITVRILGDTGTSPNNKPDKNNVLATGTLYSSLVTTSYGWIDITFDSTPTLSADTTYWLMLDTSSNNTNYWAWQNDLAQSYNRGSPQWSADWSAKSPVWTGFNGDLSFKVFLGGSPTKVDGADNLDVKGNAHANTIKDVEIDKDAYYQTLISSTVHGSSHPATQDPPPKVFPISDANITEWKNTAAAAGDPISGFSTCPTQILSRKIEGNVDLDGCNITVKSPIWITGNLTLKNNNIFTLSSEYGATSGVIIVDGQFEMKNGNHFNGTGTGSSLLMVLSNYDSRTSGLPAVNVKNNGNSGVFYAANGIISPGNGNTFKELTAWKIDLVENSTIDYETGLSSTLFSSGPSGTYSLVKGTYQVK